MLRKSLVARRRRHLHLVPPGARAAELATVPSDCAPEAPSPSIGARWQRYVLLGELGRGGMGVVHLAHDLELDRKVALKTMHDTIPLADRLERLRYEAKAMARVVHPNVVAVFDVGDYGEQPFYTMELVRGRSLQEWLAEARSWQQTRRVLVDCARGLAAVHAAGLVHRDVKPGNLLVGHDGRARVADFGVALTAAGGRLARGSTGGARSGTPAYMSPEQLRGEAVDGRSDQFSLAVVLYQALSGHRPFTGDDVEQLLRSMAGGPPALPAGIPAWLAAVVQRALAPEREARFPTMEAFARALSPRRAQAV